MGPGARGAAVLRPYAKEEALGADVAGVDGAGDGRVLCAFEDGATVGEDSHFIGRDAEAEQEIILADVSDGAREVRT